MRTTLKQLAARGVLEFSDGYRTRKDELGQSGFRIVRAGDLHSGRVHFDGPDFVNPSMVKGIGRKVVQPGDVALTTKGTVGRAALVGDVPEPAVYSPQICYFRVLDDSVLNSQFLLCWFRSEGFWSQASYLMSATDMAPYLSLKDIGNLSVDLPDLATQTAIADVLGALDDKIAANERVLASALAVARLHFAEASREAQCEWLTYDDVVEVQGGGTPRTGTPEYWGGPIRWATPTDVTALTAPVLFETSRTITEVGLSACASQLHQPGSILMTSRATIGAFAWAFRPVAVNQGFIVAKAKNPMAQLWLFFEMQSRVDDYLAHANGATFLELSRSTFKRLPVAWPSDTSVFDGFNRAAQPLLELTAALVQENERLAATRDALLPELMAGRLAVSGVLEGVWR